MDRTPPQRSNRGAMPISICSSADGLALSLPLRLVQPVLEWWPERYFRAGARHAPASAVIRFSCRAVVHLRWSVEVDREGPRSYVASL
jgi:hypothetical protein